MPFRARPDVLDASRTGSKRIGRLSMMHALVGEGEGEADAAGADAADARVAGAGVGVAGVAVADAARAVCAPAATGDEDNCSRGRDRCHAGHEHDGRHHASGRGASAERGRGGRNESTGR